MVALMRRDSSLGCDMIRFPHTSSSHVAVFSLPKVKSHTSHSSTDKRGVDNRYPLRSSLPGNTLNLRDSSICS